MGDVDGEIKTLKKALTVKDDSLLIHLALAERHEVHVCVCVCVCVCVSTWRSQKDTRCTCYAGPRTHTIPHTDTRITWSQCTTWLNAYAARAVRIDGCLALVCGVEGT